MLKLILIFFVFTNVLGAKLDASKPVVMVKEKIQEEKNRDLPVAIDTCNFGGVKRAIENGADVLADKNGVSI